MKRPKLPLSITLPMGVFARKLGMTLDEYLAIAFEEVEQPPGWEEAFASAFEPLLSRGDNDTLDTMDASETVEQRRGRPLKQRKHPFVVALLREGLTIAEVAAELKRPASSVKSWYKKAGDPAARPIPRDAAEKLRTRFGVPLTAWARIAD